MSTREENLETALDGDRDEDARIEAVDRLETANDCDKIADVLTADDATDALRERALEGLASPQCQEMLQSMLEDDRIPDGYRDRAEGMVQGEEGSGPRLT
ncbi:MAG: hypothetical protein ABEJ31_00395 [Haloarculaceae archaeon]